MKCYHKNILYKKIHGYYTTDSIPRPQKCVEEKIKPMKEIRIFAVECLSWVRKDRCEESQGVQPLVRSSATQKRTLGRFVLLRRTHKRASRS